jgi:hypothetical protein
LSPELQQAILANSLVNTRRAADSWYKTDRLVEFYNSILKKLFKNRYSFLIIVEYLFDYYILNTKFFESVANYIKSILSIKDNSIYLEKAAEIDFILIV